MLGRSGCNSAMRQLCSLPGCTSRHVAPVLRPQRPGSGAVAALCGSSATAAAGPSFRHVSAKSASQARPQHSAEQHNMMMGACRSRQRARGGHIACAAQARSSSSKTSSSGSGRTVGRTGLSPAAAASTAGLNEPAPAAEAAPSAAAAAPEAAPAAPAPAPPPPAPPLSKQQLLDTAASFVELWFRGIVRGPQAVEAALAALLAPDVVLKADQVKAADDVTGLSEVLAELERSHLEYGARSDHRPMLSAASPDSQRASALIECSFQDVGGLPGHPATFRISRVHHLVSMEVSGGRIAVLWLRRQLTEEDKDELLHEPLACFPAPFPRDALKLVDAAQREAAAGQMVGAIQAWWHSWASGPAASSSSGGGGSSSGGGRPPRQRGSASDAAAQLLAPDFRLLDAYGLYPAMRAQGRRHLSKEAALRYMSNIAYTHDVQLTVLDTAVAEGSLACFSHWQAVLTPRWRSTPSSSSSSSSGGSSSSDASSNSTAQQASVGSAASLASLASLDASSEPPGAAIDAATQLQRRQQAAFRAAARAEQQQHGGSEDEGVLVVDGLAVDLFNEAGELSVIWVFRGPISGQEMQLFLEFDRRQLQQQQAAAAALEQGGIREARRAQREQQLHELVARMVDYQQQWRGHIQHVQKQIQRQQKLARKELITYLQESGSLEDSVEEEEERREKGEPQQPLTGSQQQPPSGA